MDTLTIFIMFGLPFIFIFQIWTSLFVQYICITILKNSVATDQTVPLSSLILVYTVYYICLSEYFWVNEVYLYIIIIIIFSYAFTIFPIFVQTVNENRSNCAPAWTIQMWWLSVVRFLMIPNISELLLSLYI